MDSIFILLALLILSGFFSGAEIALFSLGATRIHALRKNARTQREKRRIARLELLKSDPNKLLVIILLGNNVVNIAASAFATVIAIRVAEEFGAGDQTGAVIGGVTGVMTFLILLFGEITPKSFAHRYALRFSLFCAPILSVLQFLLYPIVAPLALLVKKFSGGSEIRRALSEEELKAAVELSEREGKIESDERELVEKVLEFDQHAAEEIMTPRSKIFALPDDMALSEALSCVSEAQYSRIPIFHQSMDNIIGILTLRALLEEAGKKNFRQKKIANASLRQPLRVPPTIKIDTLFSEFQKEKTHLALIYDEHGGLVGLITLEDVLEEVFGEIRDESDESEFVIRQSGKKKFFCDSETELEHIEHFLREKMHVRVEHFPWSVEEENRTISYFLLEKFERFPEKGEKIKVQNDEISITFEIKKAEDEYIKEVEGEIQ